MTHGLPITINSNKIAVCGVGTSHKKEIFVALPAELPSRINHFVS